MTPKGSASERRGVRTAIAMAVAAVSLSVGAGEASAGGGGVGVPDPPSVDDVACVDTCAGFHKATVGSKVEVTGRHLANVKTIAFDGESGSPILVSPASVAARTVKARVPTGAVTGKPKVIDSYSNQAGSPNTLEIVPPDQIPDTGDFKLNEAVANPGKSFFDARKPARVRYMFSGTGATDIRIAVVDRKSGQVVDSWTETGETPGDVYTAKWRGRSSAANGPYRFRIGPVSGGLESTTEARFSFYKFKFPVRGPHSYGDGYGAPRDGHVHMGQDVLASCGTPLEAARGGTVQWKAYQAGGAGYYLVIDGRGTTHDYVYMHLAAPAKVAQGERVRTGQRIGVVGETGDATGCHLHFEVWNGDWWNGGSAMPSVGDQLRLWDSWS